MKNFKHNTSEILKPSDLNKNHDKTEQYIVNRTHNKWRLCKYLGSMLDTGEDIKWRKILAITAANQLKITYDNKKLTPETNESLWSICWAYFPLQIRNLNNNTFSSRKNHQCIPAETLENLCTASKMAEYCQKWGPKPKPQDGATSFKNEDWNGLRK